MSTFPKKEPDGATSFRFTIDQERGVLLLTDDDCGAEGIAPICCINPIMSAIFHRSTHTSSWKTKKTYQSAELSYHLPLLFYH
jgi:hypothetical protein